MGRRWVDGGAIAKWAAENPLPAAALVGAASFALLRVNYLFFYTPLGVAPEEVGVGFAQVLSLAAPGLVLLFLLSAIVAATAVLLVILMMVLSDLYTRALDFLYRRMVARTKTAPGSIAARMSALLEPPTPFRATDAFSRVTRRGVVLGLMFALVAVTLDINLAARRAAFTVFRGNPVREVAIGDIRLFPFPGLSVNDIPGLEVFPWVLAMPVLNFRATPVDIAWLEGEPLGVVPSEDSCVFYLGQSNGVTVLFVRELRGQALVGSALRVPSGSITTRTRPDCG